MIGDNRYLLLRRLVESVGGTPLPGDLETDLLEKYLTAIGGTPLPGDDFNVLLRKIVTLKGGTPTPGDNEWNLLVKWLQAEGECRACGDWPIDLWRKIVGSCIIPSSLVATGDPLFIGSTLFLDWVSSVSPSEWVIQIAECSNVDFVAPLEVTVAGTLRHFETEMANGDFHARIRQSEGDCEWVVSNCVTIEF